METKTRSFCKIGSCPICGSARLADFKSLGEWRLSKCCDCGFVLLNPQPDLPTLKALYDSPEYFQNRIQSVPSIERAQARAKSLHGAIEQLEEKLGRKGRLLEIGSGYGYMLAAARERGWDVTGLELSEHASDFSRKCFGLKIHNAPATAIESLNLGTFDAIIMLSVIEHIPDLNDAMKKVYSALVPGGLLWAVVPNVSSFDRRWHGVKWSGWDPPFHLWHFSPATVRKLCKAAGFKTVRTENSFFNPISHVRIGRKVGDFRADVRAWAIKGGDGQSVSEKAQTRREHSAVVKVLAPSVKHFLSERDMQVWAYK